VMGTPAAPPATPEATTAPSCERCKTVAHPDSMLNFGFFHDYWLCRNTGECLTRLFEARRAARAADLEARRVTALSAADPGSGTESSSEDEGASSPEPCHAPMKGIYGADTLCQRPAGHSGGHHWNRYPSDWPEPEPAAAEIPVVTAGADEPEAVPGPEQGSSDEEAATDA